MSFNIDPYAISYPPESLFCFLFIGSLLMAFLSKDFQFWFNLAITVLLAWIATKPQKPHYCGSCLKSS